MADYEYCPRCHNGVLYRTFDQDDSYGVRCAQCEYHESRVKEGFEVVKPGDPITKVGTTTKAKG
jgi:hypothetical protein